MIIIYLQTMLHSLFEPFLISALHFTNSFYHLLLGIALSYHHLCSYLLLSLSFSKFFSAGMRNNTTNISWEHFTFHFFSNFSIITHEGLNGKPVRPRWSFHEFFIDYTYFQWSISSPDWNYPMRAVVWDWPWVP